MVNLLSKLLVYVAAVGAMAPQSLDVCHCEQTHDSPALGETHHDGVLAKPGVTCCCTQPHTCPEGDLCEWHTDGQGAHCKGGGECCGRPAPPTFLQTISGEIDPVVTAEFFASFHADVSLSSGSKGHAGLSPDACVVRPPDVGYQELLCRWII